MSNGDDRVRLYLSIFVTLTFIPLIMFSGFVVSKLWLWFVVPALGVSPISIPVSLGLGLLANYLCQNWQHTKSKSGESAKEFVSAIITMYIRPLIVLLMGWIFTWFI